MPLAVVWPVRELRPGRRQRDRGPHGGGAGTGKGSFFTSLSAPWGLNRAFVIPRFVSLHA